MKNTLKVLTIAALLFTISSCGDYWDSLVDDGTIESHMNGGIVGDDGIHRFIFCGVPYIVHQSTDFGVSQNICELVTTANAPYDNVTRWSAFEDSSQGNLIWTTTNDTMNVYPDGRILHLKYEFQYNNQQGVSSMTIIPED